MKKIVTIAISLFAASAISARAADANQNWDSHCAQCHGKTGHADTKMGMKLQAKDFNDPKVQASFTDAEAASGVVTHSSGNHAAALARAAQLRGITAHIVMPAGAPQ